MLIELGIVIGGTLFAGFILLLAIVTTSGKTAFLYANARIISRTDNIISNKKCLSLCNSKNLTEMVNQLKDTEYYSQLESINKGNIKELNMALETGFIKSVKEMKIISPKRFHVIFDIYIKMYETKIIKTFFRSRFSSIPIDKDLLEPIGTINPVLLKHLHTTKSVADIGLVLRDTDYNEIFDTVYNTIEEFDIAIETKVLENIDSIIHHVRLPDKQAIKEVFHKRREIKNILTLLKLKIRDVDKKLQTKLISMESINSKDAINASNLKEFVDCFNNTIYAETMKTALANFEKTDNYYSFEKELYKYYYEFVVGKDLMYNIGPYPIISYLIKKEIELRNILIVSKGIVSEIEKGKIMEMVI